MQMIHLKTKPDYIRFALISTFLGVFLSYVKAVANLLACCPWLIAL
jgi:hypothetical protein